MSDEKKSIQLTRRRILAGVTTVGAVSTGAGAGTFALFSDSEQSTENTVQAGTLDLSRGEQSWNLPAKGLGPGDTVSGSVSLSNDGGSLSGDHVEISTSVAGENDGDEPTDSELAAEVDAATYANHVLVDSLSYGGTTLVGSGAAWQEGVYQYDYDGNGINVDALREQPDGSSGHDSAIHLTSGGSKSNDYNIVLVDVHGYDFTLNGLASGTFSHDYYGTASNEVNGPDEVILIIEDSSGNTQFLWHHKGSGDETDASWKDRDLAAELDSASNNHDWMVKHPDGTTETLGSSPLEKYGDATVKFAGIGCANTNTDNPVVVDMYYDNLKMGEGTTHTFQFPTMQAPSTGTTLSDIDGKVFDNLATPGSGTSFDVTFRLDPDAGNDFQGDGIDVTFDFGLAQEAGQDVL